MFEIRECTLPGLRLVSPSVKTDERGFFVKIFHEIIFRDHGLSSVIRESYYSTSVRGVLRGLHFQLPPEDHEKLVCCMAGHIVDAVVDLRHGSPTYGCHEVFELSANAPDCLYVPRGFAHGFFVRSETATVLYNVSTPYSPELDAGIRWDSAGIAWPEASPILSSRDKSFPPLSEFNSPFQFNSAMPAAAYQGACGTNLP